MTSAANDKMHLGPPTKQASIDLLTGWVCALPPETATKAGYAELFKDPRVTWALDIIGGVEGSSVLELGPLEASHTYMLEKAGARHVTAVEANSLCFFKCLVIKNLLQLNRSEFMLGDFRYVLNGDETWDVIWAAGVLYHLLDPVDLLHIIGKRTSKVHIWTHYIPDDEQSLKGEWTSLFSGVENRHINGRDVPHYVRDYGAVVETEAYCGGTNMRACWLKRSDILTELRNAGFSRIETAFENVDHPHGPSFAIAATR